MIKTTLSSIENQRLWKVADDLDIDASDAFLEGDRKLAEMLTKAADKLRQNQELTKAEMQYAEPYLEMRSARKLKKVMR